VWAFLQIAVKPGDIFSEGPGPQAIRMEIIPTEQAATRTVLICRTPKLHERGREQNGNSVSFEASLEEEKRELLTWLLQTSQSALQ